MTCVEQQQKLFSFPPLRRYKNFFHRLYLLKRKSIETRQAKDSKVFSHRFSRRWIYARRTTSDLGAMLRNFLTILEIYLHFLSHPHISHYLKEWIVNILSDNFQQDNKIKKKCVGSSDYPDKNETTLE